MKPPRAFLRESVKFLAFVFRRWSEDRCPQMAGSLTFTTLLALVPLLAVVAAVLAAIPYFEDAMVQVKIFLLLNLVPEIAGKIITVHMVQFTEAAGRLTAVSLAVLFAMAVMMLFTVDRALNAIWRVGRPRPTWISIMGYAALLLLGPMLAGVSLWATTRLVAASVGHIAVASPVESLALGVLPVAVSALALFLVYRFIPNCRVPALHALAGAVLAAVAFEVMKAMFGAYLRAVPTYRLVYGAFASLPIFMLWLYLSWMVLLFGAEVAAALALWQRPSWRREDSPHAQWRDGFALGRALAAAGGEPIGLAALRESARLPDDRLEGLLNDLVDTGAVRRSGKGWALAEPGRDEPP